VTDLEQDLVAVLKTQCPRVFPDTAPLTTARPYVTWFNVGGMALRYTENTAADKRMVIVQINVWHDTRIGALTLARNIEDALCAASEFVAEPNEEATSTMEEDLNLYGARQDFTILGRR
jgi:hypothetical protein